MPGLGDRQKIFISHAAPDDNEFARWLSLQLIGLGYSVWCDVINLKGGEDFWAEIEKEIREHTIKFLYVLSGKSNNREGTLKELAVAQKTKKSLPVEDSHYIIPLHIDRNLSYDDINIDLVRLNSINFKESWHKGLIQLVEKLNEDRVPVKEKNFAEVGSIWKDIILNNKATIEKEEVYSSNWFQITALPSTLHFYRFSTLVPNSFQMWKCKYPSRMYKGYFGTFAGCYDFIEELPKTQSYNPANTISISVQEILDGSYDTTFISNSDAKHIVTNLINLSFKSFFKRNGCKVYKLSAKRIAFWFPMGALEKDKAKGVLMVGKMKYGKDKRINWHFAISGSTKLDEDLCYVIKSHIVFTWDGTNLIDSDSIQHRGRRKQGKSWWNKHWREKLLSFLSVFEDESKNIPIQVGENAYLKFASSPILFQSPVTYLEPSEDSLPDEPDFDDDFSDDDLEIDIEDDSL